MTVYVYNEQSFEYENANHKVLLQIQLCSTVNAHN